MKHTLPDYLKLFLRREGKVVLGKNYSNVWLLTSVLVATFLAIAFANGSLNYLNYKMNDPFIKWVDIKKDNKEGAYRRLERELSDSLNAVKYHYRDYSHDFEYSFNVFGAADSIVVYLKTRFFDMKNRDLIEAILDKENRIAGIPQSEVEDIDDRSMGVFLTAKALARMGYEQAPAYIDLYQYSEGAEELGLKEIAGRVRVPVPVLGVVKRLPGSVDMVAFTQLYVQKIMDAVVLNMNNEAYASSLCYFIPEDVDAAEFDGRLQSLLSARTDVPFIIDDQSYDPGELHSWKNRVTETDDDGFRYRYLGFRRVFLTDTLTLSPQLCCEVNDELLQEFSGKDIHRLYPYEYSASRPSDGDYMSIQFTDLKEVKRFAEDLVAACGLEVEMAQINAKENFQSVSVMAITLSVVMVIFAIVCILLFLVNLLESYFQKVKRNIGTFKAFGISNRELKRVYMTIMLALVSAALVISLIAVSLIQLLMELAHIVKDDEFGFLSLWHCDVIHACPPLITVAAALVVVAAAAFTIKTVMDKLLSATPGDLIYDR